MYPGTIFKWFDNSQIPKWVDGGNTDVPVIPLFFAIFSADKGPEELRVYKGDEFSKAFGYGAATDFARHGQPLIQAHRIINCGGGIIGKRLVATDAALANVIFCYEVWSEKKQLTDENGNPLYVRPDGSQTTEETEEVSNGTNADGTVGSAEIVWNTELTINQANVRIRTYSLEEAESPDDVRAYAQTLFNPEGTADEKGNTVYSYPMLIVCDNGRGVSQKRVVISADYTTSKNLDFEFYTAKDIEGANAIDSARFSAVPGTVWNENYVYIDGIEHSQFRFPVIEGVAEAYISKINEILGITDFASYDILNCLTRKGKEVQGLVMTDDSVDIGYAGGVALEGGTNGSFGTAPFGTEAWELAANDFLTEDGATNDVKIYDLDIFKPTFIVDANYPLTTKNKLTELADWRKDAMLLRDMGLGLTTRKQIEWYVEDLTNSTFASDYCTSYSVYDPNNYRPIKVTMLYSMIPALVDAFTNGLCRPIAGMINGFAITEYIKNTIEYMPTITPSINEKEILEELRVNYATFSTAEDFVIETEYTSQEAYTQLSYMNNVLAIQEVARAIRTYCPKIRYKLMSGTDFTEYAEDVNSVIAQYTGNFAELQFVYTQDDIQAYNKIFSADIKFRFNNFVQTEIFNLYAEL